MEGFIFEVYVKEISEAESSSVSLLLTLTWGIDILVEKLTPQVGDSIWKTPSAHYSSGIGDFM